MGSELFYIDEYGLKQDADIHNFILKNSQSKKRLLASSCFFSVEEAEMNGNIWWDSLTRQEQLVYIKAHPKSMYKNKIKLSDEEAPKFQHETDYYLSERGKRYYKQILGDINPEAVAHSISPRASTRITTIDNELLFRIRNKKINIERGFARNSDGELEVEHHFFLIRPEYSKQGVGIAKGILRNSINFYKRIGVARVKLEANIDIGGYAWAKYGWLPTKESWNSLRYSILIWLEHVEHAHNKNLPEIDAARKILANSDPKAIRHLANLNQTVDKNLFAESLADLKKPTYIYRKKVLAKQPDQLSLGKLLLIGSDWDGILELNDEESMNHFNKYIGN